MMIKLLHTAIWVILAALIFYLIYAGISGKITPLVYISIEAIVVEGILLAIFRWRCPLTVVARKYSDSSQANFDIYLPEWLARHNKTIFSILYIIGVALVGWRLLSN